MPVAALGECSGNGETWPNSGFLGLFEEKADLGDKISFVLYMLIVEVESGVF